MGLVDWKAGEWGGGGGVVIPVYANMACRYIKKSFYIQH